MARRGDALAGLLILNLDHVVAGHSELLLRKTRGPLVP